MNMSMKSKNLILTKSILIAFFISSFITCFAYDTYESNYKESIEAYENILAESAKETTIKDIEDVSSSEVVQKREIVQKKEVKTYSIDFDHSKLPNLEGTWLLSKTVVKRLNPDIILKKPTTFYFCTAKMPIENNDIENKLVLINTRGVDSFVLNPKYPNTKDIYYDGVNEKEVEYINFGFKGEIDPYDLTYAYTMKTNNHVTENINLDRQLWLNGKLEYKHISRNRIIARGYEKQESPECKGFILNEIEIKLVRASDSSKGTDQMKGIPILEQPAYAEDKSQAPGLQFDSAKDKSNIDANSNYNAKGKRVPGMW